MSETKSGNAAVVVQLHEYDRSLGTDELNLAEFPTSLLTSRNDTGQNTLLFEDTIFDEGANRHVERTVVVAGSDHFGLPTAADSDILLLLVHLTNVRNALKEKRVEFSRYEVIKFLGWPMDGRSYKRLDEALQRWTSVTLHYKHAWWDRSRKNWKNRSFHVIETLELRGRDDIKDEGLSSFVWNDVIFESFRAGNLKRIDLGVYFSFKRPAARQMYRFLDKRFYNKAYLEFDLRQFAMEHIGLSRRHDAFNLKRKLLPALQELEEVGFLSPCSPEERFRKVSRGSWVICLQKGQRAATRSDAKTVKELATRGVNRKVARALAGQFSAEHIENKIKMHDELVHAKDRRISRNAAGFLTSAIRHDYQAASSDKFHKSRQNARVASGIASFSLPTAQDLQPSPMPDAFQRHWDTLSLEDRTRLERDALQHASKFHRDTLKRLEANNHALLSGTRLKIVRDYWQKRNPAT